MQHTWLKEKEPIDSLWPNDDYIPEVKLGDTSDILTAIEAIPMVFKGVFKEMLKQIRRPLAIDIARYDHFLDEIEGSTPEKGWRGVIAALQKAEVTFKKPLSLIKLFSLGLKLESNTKKNNPAFQRYKVYYHGSWDRWWAGQPRLSISLQKFLRDFCNLSHDMDTTLRSIHNSTLTFNPEDVAFEITNNIVKAYQHFVEGNFQAPSVSGSCMAKESTPPERHPCCVYEKSDDVLLGRLYDPDTGRTIARALLNERHKTFSRIYGSGRTPEAHEGQASYLIEQLEDAGYTRDFSRGLMGCKLPKIERCRGWLMPYLDGGACGVSNEGDHWVVTNDYEYCCDRTDGILDTGEVTCDEDEAESGW